MQPKTVYVVLGAVAALALLLGGLGGVSVVSAQESTPETDEAPRLWEPRLAAGAALWRRVRTVDAL